MSVYKSKRNKAKVLFISKARELRIYTIRFTMRLPKRIQNVFSQNINDLATKVYDHLIIANSIYLNQFTIEKIFEFRELMLKRALGELLALNAELSILSDVITKSDNAFKSNTDKVKKFQTMAILTYELYCLIRTLIESDRKRRNKWNDAESEQTKSNIEDSVRTDCNRLDPLSEQLEKIKKQQEGINEKETKPPGVDPFGLTTNSLKG